METNIKSLSKIDIEEVVIEIWDLNTIDLKEWSQLIKWPHWGYEVKYKDLNTKEYLYRLRDNRNILTQGNVYIMKSIFWEDDEGQPGDVITFNEFWDMVHIRDKDLECDFEYISELKS